MVSIAAYVAQVVQNKPLPQYSWCVTVFIFIVGHKGLIVWW
jgi:hypothetical protein